jgi:hypothetical protein
MERKKKLKKGDWKMTPKSYRIFRDGLHPKIVALHPKVALVADMACMSLAWFFIGYCVCVFAGYI